MKIPSSPTTPNSEQGDPVDMLFMLLRARYGTSFTRELPDDSGLLAFYKAEWRRGLKGLTWGQIKAAVDRARRELNPHFAPSLEQLRELAGRGGNDPHRKSHEAYIEQPSTVALPRPKPNYDRARPFIQGIRAALKGKHDPAY